MDHMPGPAEMDSPFIAPAKASLCRWPFKTLLVVNQKHFLTYQCITKATNYRLSLHGFYNIF